MPDEPAAADEPAGSEDRPERTPAAADADVRWMILLKRASEEGDVAAQTEAFTALYERHFPAVVRTLEMLLSGDRAAAEDLAQEAFLRLYNARTRYEPSAKFSTWLYRIVTNLARNWQRDRGTRRTQPSSFAPPSETGEAFALDAAAGIPEPADERTVHPEQSLVAEEIAQVVAAAIETLPASQREALILSRFREMSYQEIGEALELTPDAVKSLLARGRANLKSALAPFWQRLQRELGEEPAQPPAPTAAETSAAQAKRNET